MSQIRSGIEDKREARHSVVARLLASLRRHYPYRLEGLFSAKAIAFSTPCEFRIYGSTATSFAKLREISRPSKCGIAKRPGGYFVYMIFYL